MLCLWYTSRETVWYKSHILFTGFKFYVNTVWWWLFARFYICRLYIRIVDFSDRVLFLKMHQNFSYIITTLLLLFLQVETAFTWYHWIRVCKQLHIVFQMDLFGDLPEPSKKNVGSYNFRLTYFGSSLDQYIKIRLTKLPFFSFHFFLNWMCLVNLSVVFHQFLVYFIFLLILKTLFLFLVRF